MKLLENCNQKKVCSKYLDYKLNDENLCVKIQKYFQAIFQDNNMLVDVSVMSCFKYLQK